MKKKLIIKESELKKFVDDFLNENQLKLDFPKDSITEMLEEKYQEIVEDIKAAIDYDDADSLEKIYDEKIFPLNKNLHKLPSDTDIVNKFIELEDAIVDYTELHKEFKKIEEELETTLDNLKDLL